MGKGEPAPTCHKVIDGRHGRGRKGQAGDRSWSASRAVCKRRDGVAVTASPVEDGGGRGRQRRLTDADDGRGGTLWREGAPRRSFRPGSAPRESLAASATVEDGMKGGRVPAHCCRRGRALRTCFETDPAHHPGGPGPGPRAQGWDQRGRDRGSGWWDTQIRARHGLAGRAARRPGPGGCLSGLSPRDN